MNNSDIKSYDAYNAVPCGIVIFSTEKPCKIIYANDTYYHRYAGKNTDTLNVYAPDFDGFYNSLSQRTNGFSVQSSLDYRIETESGLLRWIRMLVSAGEAPNTLIAVLNDVTAQHNMLNMLERERKRYSVAISSSHDIIFEYDFAEDLCSFFIPSPAGSDPKTFEYENFGERIKSGQLFYLKDLYDLFFNDNAADRDGIQIKIKSHNSNRRTWYHVHCSFVYDEFGSKSKAIGSLHDIESIKEEEAQIKSKAQTDPLTKVYNRTAAIEKITPMLSRKSSLEYALFIIDLDNFKEVNDTYGHLYGDAVLSMTAGCIKSSVGEDDIVGRFGGDEFFAFIKFAHEEDIAEIAERIMQSVFNLCRNIDKNIGCSCSIGIALRRDFLDDVDFDTLFKAADSALYSAKNSGKNRFKLYDTKNIEYEYARVHDINDSASVSSVTAMALEIIAKSKSSYSAVATLLSHIGTQCNLDYIQIMHVNRTTDMVSLDHEWSRNSNTVNYAGRIGYYIHSDIERLAELLRKTGFFIFSPDIAEGFSPKFKNEFKKLDGTTVIYSAVINNDDSFNMIVYQCFTPNLVWSDKEVNTFSELTNLLSFYIGDTNLLTGREKYLQDIIDHDPLTRLYSRKKFYDLSGLVRRQAAEKNTKIYIAHCDFADFIGFNEIYSYTTGNEIMISFANMLTGAFENVLIARCEETEQFLMLIHDVNISEFIAEFEKFCSSFTEKFNPRFPKHPIVIKAGITEFKNNEWLVKALDRIRKYKKSLRNIKENKIFFVE